MTVLYFGNYNPNYARNRILIDGLKENGVRVIECNVQRGGFKALPGLFLKFLKLKASYDLMIVGFPGQEVMFLARFLTLLSFSGRALRLRSGQARKPIIFDAFTSHYEGYILDRKKYSPQSFKAKYYRFLDKWSCKLADLVLLDTQVHIDFFVREFGLPKEKFLRIFVGTDSDVFYPRKNQDAYTRKDAHTLKYSFIVHFHGNYIPLQGVRYIIKAAKILENENIVFNLIGRGQTFGDDKKLAESLELSNLNFIDPVPYEKLPDYIAEADVCLGIFGDSPKTDLVIPNKVYEALAMAKPVITADTPAIRELLGDGLNVFLCKKANPESLAEKILAVRNQPAVAEKIALNGRRLFERKLKEKFLALNIVAAKNLFRFF